MAARGLAYHCVASANRCDVKRRTIDTRPPAASVAMAAMTAELDRPLVVTPQLRSSSDLSCASGASKRPAAADAIERQPRSKGPDAGGRWNVGGDHDRCRGHRVAALSPTAGRAAPNRSYPRCAGSTEAPHGARRRCRLAASRRERRPRAARRSARLGIMTSVTEIQLPGVGEHHKLRVLLEA